jgi:peptide/nickel transport system ATP-binding protein
VTGQALLDGEDLISMPDDRLAALRWQKMSIVFQKAMNAFSPVHRIGYFMADVFRVHKPGATRAEVQKRIDKLLDLVGLAPRVAALYPHELSGGMMQRVNIAMSLMFGPKLLVLDEATTALDVVTQTQILDEIVEMEGKLGVTRVMVTHDISVVASTCKNVAVMYAGQCLETGPVEQTLLKPLHSYTQGLIESFSEGAQEGQPLTSIPGSLPDLSIPAPGCVFAPRCRLAQPACHEQRVGTTRMDDGRQVRCRRYGGKAHG